MKKKILKAFQFSLFLALAGFFLYLAFKGIPLKQLTEEILKADYSWILLSIGVSIIGFVSRAYRWKLLIEPMGYNPKLGNTFYSLMFGYLANFAFPRIGEVTRCASLNRFEKIPVNKLFGTVILERVIDMLMLILLLFSVLLFKYEIFSSFFSENVFMPILEKFSFIKSIPIAVFFITGIVGIGILFMLYKIRERLYQLKPIVKIKDFIKGIIEGLKSVLSMKKKGQFIFHTLLIWLMYWAMTYVVVFALESTSDLDAIDGLFLLIAGGLGMSAPVQGGIGAFHWIVSSALLIYNIPKEDGLVFALLSHESQALLIIGLSLYSFLMIFMKKRASIKQKNKS